MSHFVRQCFSKCEPEWEYPKGLFQVQPLQHPVELKALGVDGETGIFNQQIQVIYMHTKFWEPVIKEL